MNRDMLYEHPAVAELFNEFRLHDDFVKQKLKNWVERWLSCGAVEAAVTELPTVEQQQELLNGLFGEVAQKYAQPKAVASAANQPNGEVVFRLAMFCLNRVAAKQKTLGPLGLIAP